MIAFMEFVEFMEFFELRSCCVEEEKNAYH